MAAHDLLKGREYNRNKAMEGFDEVNDPRIARAVHQNGYADVLLRPTMVGILRCGKMLPPQLNLVIEIEFADATTALWSENAGAHPAGATLSTDFEIQNVRVLASQVVLDLALVESFNRALLPGRSQRHRGARLHETDGRVRDLLVGAAKQEMQLGSLQYPHNPHERSLGALPLPLGPCGHLQRHGAQHRHRPCGLPATQLHRFATERVPKMPLSGVSTRLGDLARFTFKGLDGTMTDLFIHL